MTEKLNSNLPTITVSIEDTGRVSMELNVGDMVSPEALINLSVSVVEASIALQKQLFSKLLVTPSMEAAANETAPPEDIL